MIIFESPHLLLYLLECSRAPSSTGPGLFSSLSHPTASILCPTHPQGSPLPHPRSPFHPSPALALLSPSLASGALAHCPGCTQLPFPRAPSKSCPFLLCPWPSSPQSVSAPLSTRYQAPSFPAPIPCSAFSSQRKPSFSVRFSRSSQLPLIHDLPAHCCQEGPGDPTPDAPLFCPHTLGTINLPVMGMHLLNVFFVFLNLLSFFKETTYIEKVTDFLKC